MEQPSATDRASRAWEAVKGDVGFAVHESFKARQVQNGFADHPWNPLERSPRVCETCYLGRDRLQPRSRHHDHQVAWERLAPNVRESYTRQGEVPWKMGYLSGMSDYVRDAMVGMGVSLSRDAVLGTDVADHPFRPQPDGPGLPRVEEPTPVCWQHDEATGGICGRPEDEHALEGMVGG